MLPFAGVGTAVGVTVVGNGVGTSVGKVDGEGVGTSDGDMDENKF